jgi:hypothetical protein
MRTANANDICIQDENYEYNFTSFTRDLCMLSNTNRNVLEASS